MENAQGATEIMDTVNGMKWRETTQPLLPAWRRVEEPTQYEHFPAFSLAPGSITRGFGALCDWMSRQQMVLIDGYAGVFYEETKSRIDAAFKEKGIKVCWHHTAEYLKPEAVIDALVQPFLGEKDDVWGTRTTLELRDLYEDGLSALQPDERAELNIVIGPGAALCGWDAPIVYLELPKNELQYRMRAGVIRNLGSGKTEAPATMYKRFYFVDWVVLDKHRNDLLDRIAVLADAQWKDDISFIFAHDLKTALEQLSRSAFRARPWFEKGSWGGQWMKAHLPGINTAEVNYAWSFELITPENGLIFESDGNLLELSFDLMMQYAYEAVQGKHAKLFGPYFPIRFDFLDTFDGGNLSIQCHPSKAYIRERFGETITQDETYYILDCEPGAGVYLGFQEDIDPQSFRDALEHSQRHNEPLDVERYIQRFPSHKHDLFLIPNGTVHSSGKNNMVLEISATPYIFTFKMYDWLSLDLEGKPRPINIGHAFNNLRFERKGEVVREQHISRPRVLDSGADWELLQLPTHPDHFYDIERAEFDSEFSTDTQGACHVLMLVEGSSIGVLVEGQAEQRFNYAETFIVPAAAGRYRLVNYGSGRARVVRSFVQDGYSG